MADSLIGTNVITYKRTADILQQSTEETSSSVQRWILFSSVAWIQKERWKRKSGQPHILDIDPVIIGNTPRYRASDISAWIEQQSG